MGSPRQIGDGVVMPDLNDIVLAIVESCLEHLESAATASDDGDAAAREFHLDQVHSRLQGIVAILRGSS